MGQETGGRALEASPGNCHKGTLDTCLLPLQNSGHISSQMRKAQLCFLTGEGAEGEGREQKLMSPGADQGVGGRSVPMVEAGAGASGPLAECFGESRVEGSLCEAAPLFSHVSHLTRGYCSYFSSSPPLCSAMLASSPFLKLTPPQGLCTAVPSA